MSEGLRLDPAFLEAERDLARMEEIWKQLAGGRILEDDEAIALAREYRELQSKQREVA